MRYDLLLEGLCAHIDDRRRDGVGDAVRALFAQHGARFDAIEEADVLVHIAQTSPQDAPDLAVRDAFIATRQALSGMMKRAYGSLIYLQPNRAIEALARGTAMDVCKFAIRANCIRYDLGFTGVLGMPVTAEDIANAALYLASPISRNATGEVLYVDAGKSTTREGAHAG